MPCIDQIPVEFIPAGGRTVRFKVHKPNSNWNAEELLQQWKECIIMMFCCYQLLCTYKILLGILLSKLAPYVDKIIGCHRCDFRRKRLIIDQIFTCRYVPREIWEYNTVAQD